MKIYYDAKIALQAKKPSIECNLITSDQCCQHTANITFPTNIETEVDITKLCAATTLASILNTNCVDHGVCHALWNIGIKFEEDHYCLWKFLLGDQRINNAIWLEYAVCEDTSEKHPNFQMPEEKALAKD